MLLKLFNKIVYSKTMENIEDYIFDNSKLVDKPTTVEAKWKDGSTTVHNIKEPDNVDNESDKNS